MPLQKRPTLRPSISKTSRSSLHEWLNAAYCNFASFDLFLIRRTVEVLKSNNWGGTKDVSWPVEQFKWLCVHRVSH